MLRIGATTSLVTISVAVSFFYTEKKERINLQKGLDLLDNLYVNLAHFVDIYLATFKDAYFWLLMPPTYLRRSLTQIKLAPLFFSQKVYSKSCKDPNFHLKTQTFWHFCQVFDWKLLFFLWRLVQKLSKAPQPAPCPLMRPPFFSILLIT